MAVGGEKRWWFCPVHIAAAEIIVFRGGEPGIAMVDQTKGTPGFYSQRIFRSRTMSKSLIPDAPGSTSNLRRVIRGQDLRTTWNIACPSFFYPLVNSWETHMRKTGAFGLIQFNKKFSLLVCFHFLFLNKRYKIKDRVIPQKGQMFKIKITIIVPRVITF